jgi:cysteinyl-tRNA synthetase
MFQIMTSGLTFSRHETRAEAESAMADAIREALAEKEIHLDAANESEAFANSFSIETA